MSRLCRLAEHKLLFIVKEIHIYHNFDNMLYKELLSV